jgi:uncharacterized protein YdiU (UPF0061 family)
LCPISYPPERLRRRLGLEAQPLDKVKTLIIKTLEILKESQINYSQFFATLAQQFNPSWRTDAKLILENITLPRADWETWRKLYHQILNQLPQEEMEEVSKNLSRYNPQTALLRPLIETVWQAIAEEDNWQPFQDLVKTLQSKT